MDKNKSILIIFLSSFIAIILISMTFLSYRTNDNILTTKNEVIENEFHELEEYGNRILENYESYLILNTTNNKPYINDFIKGKTNQGYLEFNDTGDILNYNSEILSIPSNLIKEELLYNTIYNEVGIKPFFDSLDNIGYFGTDNHGNPAIAYETKKAFCMSYESKFTKNDYLNFVKNFYLGDKTKINYSEKVICISK